ncbi:hypothetical protein [Gluconobacter morbifer]|uniref:Uncharacterized protein n=1 Tax=Gluconobacter morbifer G707 TaxID=1088869 RepID=G6XIU0_9PROT|nr:hypothetical protein [Gluconobacter morbifer]EHH68266.1 hypothetical protein GMO_10360 [Gluconobacter morbifer G707]
MSEIIPLRPALPKADTLWAVIAFQGKRRVIADLHLSREAAEADCQWRMAQVRAYARFLISEQQPPPAYMVERIRKTDLPRRWEPLPALGMLRGRFI